MNPIIIVIGVIAISILSYVIFSMYATYIYADTDALFTVCAKNAITTSDNSTNSDNSSIVPSVPSVPSIKVIRLELRLQLADYGLNYRAITIADTTDIDVVIKDLLDLLESVDNKAVCVSMIEDEYNVTFQEQIKL